MRLYQFFVLSNWLFYSSEWKPGNIGSFRSSRPELFCRKGVLGNFTKFTEKHLYRSLFFNRIAGLRPATLSKKRLWHRCFFQKENLKKCACFEEQKYTRYIRGNVNFGIIVFSCLSSIKMCLRFLLICFAWEIKSFYQSFLKNEVDFTDIMNVSPNILHKN